MSDQNVRRKLDATPAELDRLAFILARLADAHRKQHRRLSHPKCVTCSLLHPIRDEPSVVAAHDQHHQALTVDIEKYIDAIPPKENHA